jgi:glycosyltransferase involved in cell wall biosynthesis
MSTHDGKVGIVVIGRNEGRRLVDCLASLGDLANRTIYVDSGSTDCSQSNASSAGAQLLALNRN